MDRRIIDAAFPSRPQAAAAVLQGLQSSAARLAELREAAQRPESRYPVVYDLDNPWSILLPHLAGVRGACNRLQLRACAALAAGDPDAALQDVLLGLRLADSLENEPFLISMLVRAGSVRLLLQPVWEGLADRRWSEPQLQRLQDRLERYNFIASLEHSTESERAAALWTVDLMARGKFSFSQLDSDLPGGSPGLADDAIRDLVGRLAPRGWYRLEQVNYCRLLDQLTSGAIDAGSRRVFPAQAAANAEELERAFSSGRVGKDVSGVLRHQFFAALLLPGLQGLPRKAAAAQVAVDEARIACALERYRLARGAFPESLAVLAPEWMTPIPSDPLTGAAYNYRRTDPGQFTLSSVGWDRGESSVGSARTNVDGHDRIWTWEYPDR